MLAPGAYKRREPNSRGLLLSDYFVLGFAGGAGNCDGLPMPVVLGAGPRGVPLIPVVLAGGDEVLLAVLFTFLLPAIKNIAISAITTMPAIQPQTPAPSLRRPTGSLSCELLYRGSVKRGSDMSPSIVHGAGSAPSRTGETRGRGGGSWNVCDLMRCGGNFSQNATRMR